MTNFIKASDYASYLDVPYAENFARMHLRNPNGVTIGIEDNGLLLGMLAAIAGPHPFLPVVSASDLCWWVEPQARGNRKGLELLKAFEYWAVHIKKAKILNLASMNNPRVDKVYARMGYTKTEHLWTKVV